MTASNIQENLIQRLDVCQFYSLALDESMDLSDKELNSPSLLGDLPKIVLLGDCMTSIQWRAQQLGRTFFMKLDRFWQKSVFLKESFVA